MNQDIYQHYGKEEKSFIDQVFGWMQQVENRYVPYLSGFLTPREAMITEQLVATNDDLSVSFNGGYENAERKRALIVPSYYEPSFADYNLCLLEVKFPVKFAEITHGRILGTVLSTGIDRQRIGDIMTDGTYWQLILDDTISEFIKTNVTKIGNVGVHLENIEIDSLLTSNEQWEITTIISSSMRLDALLSKVYNISRQRAKEAVAAGYVKMNFAEMSRGDIEVKLNDIVSLRKYGRFWVKSVDGVTKKDNYRLTVHVLSK
ncbi:MULTISPECIES: YlmH/Sll1252 family protein [unclassified Facklamia]|uniref:YlmH family RNA-binding protein n=1 Tax=Aerococcaceae TaxID=186827 RepID=UPI0013BCF0E5|nr:MULTISPECIES: YlmH/Sll1252 family protein [unclassified Facklamia]NEW63746.1 RNA-binding protein [Facklamia sp. 252]NEW67217.1 RNA-binding protein [Facklamia sp. 253]QQD66245.1 RNA-binding protein [Aerococcaceae bacterium zg-252]